MEFEVLLTRITLALITEKTILYTVKELWKIAKVKLGFIFLVLGIMLNIVARPFAWMIIAFIFGVLFKKLTNRSEFRQKVKQLMHRDDALEWLSILISILLLIPACLHTWSLFRLFRIISLYGLQSLIAVILVIAVTPQAFVYFERVWCHHVPWDAHNQDTYFKSIYPKLRILVVQFSLLLYSAFLIKEKNTFSLLSAISLNLSSMFLLSVSSNEFAVCIRHSLRDALYMEMQDIGEELRKELSLDEKVIPSHMLTSAALLIGSIKTSVEWWNEPSLITWQAIVEAMNDMPTKVIRVEISFPPFSRIRTLFALFIYPFLSYPILFFYPNYLFGVRYSFRHWNLSIKIF